ncbi:DUF393 domain-containing protein [Puteibacter caeruleilacunae]|nr:DUF393 domain-containing protein [Puteibacter caeruleilacunae]
MVPSYTYPILVIDGECMLCNKLVNVIIEYEKEQDLTFTSLSSSFYQQLKSNRNIPENIDSIVYISKDQYYFESDAAIQVSKHLTYPLRALYYSKYVPKNIRDYFYRIIARNRKKWFGTTYNCTRIKPENRRRFIL